MWTASAWNCELSPTKIRVRHWSFFNDSVKSCRLMDRVVKFWLFGSPFLCLFRSCTTRIYSCYLLIAWRNRQTLVPCLSSSNCTKDYHVLNSICSDSRWDNSPSHFNNTRENIKEINTNTSAGLDNLWFRILPVTTNVLHKASESSSPEWI